jgi:hypothetical protein
MTTVSITDSGDGASCRFRFRFRVHGTIGDNSIDKTGYFIFSTTGWPTVGHPDYALLGFQSKGSEASTIYQKVPTLVTPDPFYCAFALKDNELVLITSRENNLSTTIISNVVSGIITAHTKALGWLFGKVW